MAVTWAGGPRWFSHSAALHEFLGQAEIDEVAGDGDVVGVLLDHVFRDDVEDLAPVREFPPAMPVDVAEHAFAHQLAAPHERHRAQMDIGEVGEGEHCALTLGKGRWVSSQYTKGEPEATKFRLILRGSADARYRIALYRPLPP